MNVLELKSVTKLYKSSDGSTIKGADCVDLYVKKVRPSVSSVKVVLVKAH